MVNYSADLVNSYEERKFANLLLNTHNDEEKYLAKSIYRQINAVIIPHNFLPIKDNDTISLGVATTIPSQEASVKS